MKNFLQKAFADMKKSAIEQHKADKANLDAIKAESKLIREEAKAKGNPKIHKAVMQAQREEQITKAEKRKEEAHNKINTIKTCNFSG